MRKWYLSVILACLLALVAGPVLAAPAQQSSGGVRFGPFTLEEGNSFSEDLVVFGGPVRLMEDAVFDGDLTVFGPMEMDEGSTLEGQLVVTGEADLAGMIEGDVFIAGAVTLRDTAVIMGDVSTVGAVDRAEGAVVEGELLLMDEEGWQAPWILRVPGRHVEPQMERPFNAIDRTPRWVVFLLRLIRGAASVVVLSLIGLVVATLWPVQIGRVGRVIEEVPLNAYWVGLLALLGAGLAALLLTITICLSPFALIGIILVSIGVLFGWIGVGWVLGRRILVSLFDDPSPGAALSAVVGTAIVTLIVAMARVMGVFDALLLVLLVPPAAGAVLLTRFGTMPYATHGQPMSAAPATTVSPPPPPPPPAPPGVTDFQPTVPPSERGEGHE